MPKHTKTVARRVKNRTVTAYGEKPRKKEEVEQSFYGELTLHIKDYRLLPVDDPLRVHIETRYGLRATP